MSWSSSRSLVMIALGVGFAVGQSTVAWAEEASAARLECVSSAGFGKAAGFSGADARSRESVSIPGLNPPMSEFALASPLVDGLESGLAAANATDVGKPSQASTALTSERASILLRSITVPG